MSQQTIFVFYQGGTGGNSNSGNNTIQYITAPVPSLGNPLNFTSGPFQIPGALLPSSDCSPAACYFNDNLYVFHQGNTNNTVYYNTSTNANGVWNGETLISSPLMSGSPSATIWNDSNTLYLFHQGQGDDGQLWYTNTPETVGWANDQPVPGSGTGWGTISGSPSAIVLSAPVGSQATLAVWFNGGGTINQGALHSYFNQGLTNWGTPNGFGLTICQSPSAVMFKNTCYVFYQEYGSTILKYICITNDSSYNGPFPVANSEGINAWLSNSPSAVATDDTIYVFYQDNLGVGQLYYSYSTDGTNWGTDQMVNLSPSQFISNSPYAIVVDVP